MKKLLKAILFAALFYGIPLLGAPEKLVDWRILFLVAAAILVFLTQPEIKSEDMKAASAADRASFHIILLSSVATQVIPVLEWAYLSKGSDLPLTLVGMVIVAAGLFIRVSAIRTLGEYFTASVKVRDEQPVITRGVYRIVRHPSYFGAWLAVLGSAVFLNAWVSLPIITILMFGTYVYRIQVEEEHLVSKLGSSYLSYMKQIRFRLVPFVW